MPAKSLRNQTGSVIVISMIILIVFAAIISVLALIVVNNLRYVVGYSQALQSHYAAETGVEQGLYYTQAGKTAKTIDLDSLHTFVTSIAANNTTQYTITFTTNSDTSLTLPLKDQETKQLNLYTESDNGSYLVTTPLPIGALILQWTGTTCSDGHTNNIELSDTSWTAQSWDTVTQNRWIYDSCPSTSGGCAYSLQPDFLYKVRFKSLYCTVDDFTVSATDADNPGEYLDLQDTITLTATGYYGKSQQQVTAEILWRSPLINYFDYVLFSEEQVTK